MAIERRRSAARSSSPISCGGALAELARDAGALHLPCPDGIPAAGRDRRARRAAASSRCSASGFAPGGAREPRACRSSSSRRRRDKCRPAVEGAANPARELARQIGRTIPLVYGGGALGGVAAYRWKCDVNENAKAPAFWHQYPELDHNEICAWGQHGDVTRQLITLIELRHGFEHARLARALRRDARDHRRVRAPGALRRGRRARAGSRQLLDLMYLGDWVSCYLALQNDVDPGPIDAIFELKSRLAKLEYRMPAVLVHGVPDTAQLWDGVRAHLLAHRRRHAEPARASTAPVPPVSTRRKRRTPRG